LPYNIISFQKPSDFLAHPKINLPFPRDAQIIYIFSPYC